MKHILFCISILFVPTLCLRAETNDVIRRIADLTTRLTNCIPSSAKFSLTAKVTYARYVPPEGNETPPMAIAVEDDSGAIVMMFYNPDVSALPTPGDVAQISGALKKFHYGRVGAAAYSFKRISHELPPRPIDVNSTDLLFGKYDFRLCRLRGTVRSAIPSDTSSNWTILILNSDNERIFVSVPTNADNCDELLSLPGTDVSVVGICTPNDLSPRRKIGRTFKLASSSDISILRTAQETMHDVPKIEDITVFRPSGVSLLGRHRTRGHVLAVWNTNHALLKTANNELVHAEFLSSPSPPCGSSIDCVGFPDSDLFSINLTSAIWTRCDDIPSRENKPIELTAKDILGNDVNDRHMRMVYHGKTVKISGTVRSVKNPDTIYLESDSQILPIDTGNVPDAQKDVSIGYTISVRGICVMETSGDAYSSSFPKIKNIFIVVRRSDDIRILSYPPWWTPGRLLAVIGALLAALVGIILWNASLRHIAARKGRELFRAQLGQVKADLRTEERTRLAVELHDTLAQNLTGVSMEIEAANDLRGDAPKPMLDHLGIAAKALKSCRDELRNCLWDLRSQALEEPDMTKAVLKTLQPVVNDSRLAVRFNVPRARLSDNTAHALLRVVRELVVNAIRHGNASSVRVAGTIDREQLLCSVTDDGCGFDPETVPGVLQGHFGLQGIRERLDEIGGTFEITSAPGKGTKATISIPIPHES